MADPLVFVVGCGRSGSTLLRAMLDSHGQVAIPPETHIVPTLLSEGADNQGRLDRREFVRCAVQSGYLPTWGLDAKTLATLLDELSATDVAEAVRAMYGFYADAQSKPLVGEKTPNYVRDLSLLSKRFPNSRFIHLVRDPRDVALSFRRVGFEKHLGVTAGRWRRIMNRWDQGVSDLGDERCLEVRYEDLVADPRGVLEGICSFLGLEIDDGMLRYHERADRILEGVDDPALHPHIVDSPSLRSEWESQLSVVEAGGIQKIVGTQLGRRGYVSVPIGRTPAVRFWAVRAQAQLIMRQGAARLRRRRHGVRASHG